MKKAISIALLSVTLTLNASLVYAQQRRGLFQVFVDTIFEELTEEAARYVLTSLFETSAEAVEAENTQRSVICEVRDPTGTPLNVRSSPNGTEIVRTLDNGSLAIPYNAAFDEQDRTWLLVGNTVEEWGWVFGSYVHCDYAE